MKLGCCALIKAYEGAAISVLTHHFCFVSAGQLFAFIDGIASISLCLSLLI